MQWRLFALILVDFIRRHCCHCDGAFRELSKTSMKNNKRDFLKEILKINFKFVFLSNNYQIYRFNYFRIVE